MCDPTVLAIGSTVAGLAGSAAEYMGQQQAADEQQKAYDEWAAQQASNRRAAAAKDEANRQQADVARAKGLQDVSPEAQKTAQQAEQDRLTAYLQGNKDSAASNETTVPTAVSDARLSGQSSGDSTFQSDLTSKLDQANANSKQRIAALAAVGSYGGSFGGLDNTVANAFQTAGQGIDLANDFRRGDMAVYGTQQAVNPITYTYTKSPIAGIANQALSFGTQGLGKMLAGATKVG